MRRNIVTHSWINGLTIHKKCVLNAIEAFSVKSDKHVNSTRWYRAETHRVSCMHSTHTQIQIGAYPTYVLNVHVLTRWRFEANVLMTASLPLYPSLTGCRNSERRMDQRSRQEHCCGAQRHDYWSTGRQLNCDNERRTTGEQQISCETFTHFLFAIDIGN